MGWRGLRKFLAGCCGGRPRKSATNDGDHGFQDDLGAPRNPIFLPRPVPLGCRGYFVIFEDGSFVQLRNPPMDCDSPHSFMSVPPDNSMNAAAYHLSTNTTGSDGTGRSNGEMLSKPEGPPVFSDNTAQYTSYSDSSSDDDYVGLPPNAADKLSQQFSSLSIVKSNEKNLLVGSAASTTKVHVELHKDNAVCPQHGPKLVAARKRKVPEVEKRQAGGVKGSSDTTEEPTGMASCSTQSAAACSQSYENDLNLDNVDESSTAWMHTPENTLPTLADNPEAYWKILRSLSRQLEPLLNPSGPKVTRKHSPSRDGCICRFLFPDEKPPQPSEGPISFTMESFNPQPQPIRILQMPMPQRAIIGEAAPNDPGALPSQSIGEVCDCHDCKDNDI